jgi:hypothetical protein
MTEVKEVRRRRRIQLLSNLTNRRQYWDLKEEADDPNKWKREFIT